MEKFSDLGPPIFEKSRFFQTPESLILWLPQLQPGATHMVRPNQIFFLPIYHPRWVLQSGQLKNFWAADSLSSPYWAVVLKDSAAG